MKTLFITLFMLSSILFSQPDTLTILHLNDTHSCLAPSAPRTALLEGTTGGIARAASVIGLTKMTEQNVLTLHAGDFFVGDLFFNFYFGVPELQLLQGLGVDAIAVGNHEFDLMPSTLIGALQAAFPALDQKIPLLSANAIMEDTSVAALKDYIQPYTIKEYGKIKVGIFGMTTTETNTFSLPSPVVIDTNIFVCAATMVETLKSNGCNVIIMLSHLGRFYDEAMAQNIPGINIIVSGHDHYLTDVPVVIENNYGGKTWFVQADAFYSRVGKMKIAVDGENISLVDYQSILLDENIPEEPATKAIVDQLIAGLETQLNWKVFTEKIGDATETFEEVADVNRSGNFDTPVGNLVTDAFRQSTKTQIAIQLGGSTAQKLYKGPIVPADVFRMLGYGFNEVNGLGYRLATFKITGAELWKGFEICLATAEYNDEMLPQVSGMEYSFNVNSPVYSRLLSIKINGVDIDFNATYTATANEFFVSALPLFGVSISDLTLLSEVTELQVVVGYITTNSPISPGQSGRVTDTKETGKILPDEFQLKQNYPNPFNPTTTISYSIEQPSFVTLKIYDITGNEVETLVNEYQSSGMHSAQFGINKKPLASGVYFYRLQSTGKSLTKSMLLLK
ncbi:MAG: 5'-nucleotidase C-terminal domain-containing protein [Ignavibacteriaceae bacterium]|nr:5'-nucleotidase C-terminal domain-containing protein [Ignavibacteriaceae bacterium]